MTAADRGIGKTSAISLAKAGADVAINDIDEKMLEDTAKDSVRSPGRVYTQLPEDQASTSAPEVNLIPQLPS